VRGERCAGGSTAQGS